MWNAKNVLAVSILKCSPRSYAFLRSLFPLLSRRILQFLLNTIQTMSDKVHVCCFMFDEMSVRRLTVMEALRTLEAMAGLAVLHIMPWSSCSVVYIKSGSNQWLSIWFAEPLNVRRLLFSWGRFLKPSKCRTANCCHRVWHGCQQCQGLVTVGCFWKDTFFFRFHNQDIAAVFDYPFPLKCTHNLFHKHDMTNVWLGVVVVNGQRLTGAAKWADIVYEIPIRVCCIICCIMWLTDMWNVLHRVPWKSA